MKKYIYFLICIPSYLFSVALGDFVQTRTNQIQSDQKIIVAGSVISNNKNKIFISRYTTAGILDSSFNGNGIVSPTIGNNDEARSIAIDGSGNILVAGVTDNQGFITRYNSSGTLDTSFGTNGIVKFSIDAVTRINVMALQADGKIVVGGTTGGVMRMFVARFTTSGALDVSTFSVPNGYTIIALDNRSEVLSLKMQGNNIVAAGFSEESQGDRFAQLARFDANGDLDLTFGVDGFATINDEFRQDFADLDFQTTGSIIAVGASNDNILIARFSDSGVLDTNFGVDGVITTSVGNSNRADVAIIDTTNSNEIIIGGLTDELAAMIKYDQDGTLDTSFGDNGIVQVKTDQVNRFTHGVLQTDGQIIMTGPAIHNAFVARFSNAGILDVSGFGVNGFVNDLQGFVNLSGAVTLLWDQKSQNTAGGTFTLGAWRVRDLNQLSGNVGGVSLSSNEFTLQPGVYAIEAKAPAYAVGNHQIRLFNVTDSRVEATGTSTSALSILALFNVLGISYSFLEHVIQIGAPKTYRIEHRCLITQATSGFGIAANISGSVEVYTQVKIRKLV
jgi:uncharacterized delta-60 repeat protein